MFSIYQHRPEFIVDMDSSTYIMRDSCWKSVRAGGAERNSETNTHTINVLVILVMILLVFIVLLTVMMFQPTN